MNTIAYLKNVYGYFEPIFLKDIRIGRKSKVAIRKELSRAVEKGLLARRGQGVYSLIDPLTKMNGVTFEAIVERRFVKDDYGIPGLNLDIYGYYTGHTFLNQIGISQQVPAVIEVTTNNTSCKRNYVINNRTAILRKGKVTIDRFNYRILQFFDMFSLLNDDEMKESRELLVNYLVSSGFLKTDCENYLNLYSKRIQNIVRKSGLLEYFK